MDNKWLNFDVRLSRSGLERFAIHWLRYTTHAHHTHHFNVHLPGKPGLVICPLYSQSPSVPNHSILLGQANSLSLPSHTPTRSFSDIPQTPLTYTTWHNHHRLYVQHVQTILICFSSSPSRLVPIPIILPFLHHEPTHDHTHFISGLTEVHVTRVVR